jgi:predicted ATP-grasp superfamily ATP-dependent carboligase
MMNVLVLDAKQRSALAVVRSLGARGLTVYAADCCASALAGASKYVKEYLISPDPVSNSETYIDWLSKILVEKKIGFVQPVTEVTCYTILRRRDAIPGHCVLPFGSYEQVMRLADKTKLVRIAESLGLPVPKTLYCANRTEFNGHENLRFPIVVKPALSKVPSKSGFIETSVRVCNSQLELDLVFEKDHWLASHPFMIQEYIDGTGAGMFVLYNQGVEVASFAHIRVREKPPRGGVSVLSESVPINHVQHGIATNLFEAANWHGVAMLEFRISKDGLPYIMEVNPRFWGSLQLAIDCGVDFPWYLYQLSVNGAFPAASRYYVGRRLRWLLGDLDSLYLYVKDNANSIREKALRLMGFLLPFQRSTRQEVFRWSDPRPGFRELYQWVRELLR